MEFIKNIFSDPIWNGIQGAITVLTFLFLMREKQEQIVPYFKNLYSVLIELVRVLILIFFAWLYSYFLFFIFSDIVVIFLIGFFSPPIDFNSFVYDVLSWPPKYINYILPSALAAMSSIDKKLSKERAVRIGIIVSVVMYIYVLFFSEFSSLWKDFVNVSSFGVTDVSLLLFFIIVVILSITLGTSLIGEITGRLCTRGVYFGRVTIEKISFYLKEILIEKVKSHLEIFKNYLPK